MRTANRNPGCIRVLEETLEIPRTCLRNFECRNCAFDQWLDYTDIGPDLASAEDEPERAAA